MDILKLKAKLLEQHHKDKQQTLRKNILLLILGIIILICFCFIFKDSITYLLIIGGVLIIGLICYSYIELKKLDKREKQIERFIDKIKAGDKVIDSKELHRYKLAPFRFLKFCAFPVHYISIAFSTNPTKYYTLPVDKSFVQEIRTKLIQSNNKSVSAARKDFLNEDISLEANEKRIPLKNVDEFKDFLYTDLQFSFNDIEKKRRIPKPMLIIASILLFIVALAWLYYMYILLFDDRADLLSSPYEMLFVIGVFFGVFYATYFLYFQSETEEMFIDDETMLIDDSETTTSDFKNKILNQVVQFINPQAQYVMDGHIDPELVMKSGLFKNQKEYDITGNDFIIGKYNGVRFQFSDLLITHIPLFSDNGGVPDIVFQGQFFMARLGKTLPNPVYIVVRKARSIFYGLSDISGSEIELDDKEFMKLFEVYAINTEHAEEVLTPVFREGLKRVLKRIPGDYYISFCGDLLTVANNSGKDSFEIEYASSLIEDDYAVLIDFFKELYGDFIIIDDLRLKDYV